MSRVDDMYLDMSRAIKHHNIGIGHKHLRSTHVLVVSDKHL